jgi:hypothetical protein
MFHFAAVPALLVFLATLANQLVSAHRLGWGTALFFGLLTGVLCGVVAQYNTRQTVAVRRQGGHFRPGGTGEGE